MNRPSAFPPLENTAAMTQFRIRMEWKWKRDITVVETVQGIRFLVAGIVLEESVAGHVLLDGRFVAVVLAASGHPLPRLVGTRS